MEKNLIHISDLILYEKNYEEIMSFLTTNKIKNLELFIEPLDKKYNEKMLKILENYNFFSISFHGPFRKCNLADLTEEAWEKALYSYEESLKIIENYKPSFLVLHTNESVPGKIIDDDLRNKIIEKIDYLIKLGKKYNVDIVIENVGIRENMVFSQNEYENLILKNNYKCLIDIGHAFLNEWDIESCIKKLKNNILGYHFHNNDGVFDSHETIFKGVIDYKEIVEYVKKYTPTAKIVLEYDFSRDLNILLEDKEILENML
ncbi:sugar phosphate isomerase/epimerase family protein [Fusobacterium russii]|uniref:sugar phosphate isomerase/epimerase family protein n=1 Tax=Fusobacterium russii TaxID=854 RepID=UPI00039D6D1D|nr:TIM barrel protein [Fusobacterium russii]